METACTINSGTAWTTKAACTFGTQIYDVSFPTTSLIVVGGNDAAGNDHIVFSTDGGTNWTNATTSPAGAVAALDMYDGTNGMAIRANADVWKTVDGAVNWTNTGTAISGASNIMACYMTSATNYVVAVAQPHGGGFAYRIRKGDLTSGTYSNVDLTFGSSNDVYCSEFYKSTNGNLYILFDEGRTTMLLKSPDNGTSWYSRILDVDSQSDRTIKCGVISEGANNEILVIKSNNDGTYVDVKIWAIKEA